jgi:hypothetical protein
MDARERLVIRYAHLGSGRNPRNRETLERNRQDAQRHIEAIWAEQEAKNAALPDLTGQGMWPLSWSPERVRQVSGKTPEGGT